MPETFEAEPGNRRADLESLRQLLVTEIDNDGHAAACECSCSRSARDGRTLALLSAELRKVNQELEKLPGAEGKSRLDQISNAVADELAAHREARAGAARGTNTKAAKRPRVQKDAR